MEAALFSITSGTAKQHDNTALTALNPSSQNSISIFSPSKRTGYAAGTNAINRMWGGEGGGAEGEVWRRLQFGASPEQLSGDQQLKKFWSLTK